VSAAQGRSRPGVILGIDPGGVDTGLVVRRGDTVLEQLVVHRAKDETGPRGVGVGPDYLARAEHDVRKLIELHDVDLVGLEGVVRPNPHVKRKGRNVVTDPAPIIATAIVLGHLTAVAGSLGVAAVWVPPGKNGSLPLYAYPAELVSDAERRHGLNRVGDGGILRHARSAFDVAGTALVMSRLRASTPAIPRAL
jgi:hypothetical protein